MKWNFFLLQVEEGTMVKYHFPLHRCHRRRRRRRLLKQEAIKQTFLEEYFPTGIQRGDKIGCKPKLIILVKCFDGLWVAGVWTIRLLKVSTVMSLTFITVAMLSYTCYGSIITQECTGTENS